MKHPTNQDKKIVLNPFVVGNWEDGSFVLINTITKKKYSFSFPIFDLMFFLNQQNRLSSLVKKIRNIYGIDAGTSREIVSMLLESDIIHESEKLRDNNIWFERNWRNALYFHLLTRNCEFMDMGQEGEFDVKTNVLKNYLSESSFPAFYKEYNDNNILLPKPKMDYVSSGQVLLNRRTSRRFGDIPVTLEQLSTILYYTCQPAKAIRDYANRKKKDNPMILVLSAYTPYEIYFSNNNIEGLKKGLYHYNMNKHEI
ncbi:MAG TPA: hypothetical protein VG935_03875, partial [Patescibacteria group bacterium]|nr:hypothetical protein [Patescibacteria group bacterium]